MLKDLEGHENTIYALKFDNSSSILCSGGLDKTVKFWNFNKTITTKKNDNQSNELIHSISFNFSIHSIVTDSQNVFYTMGAAKTGLNEVNNQQTGTTIDSTSIKIENIEVKENLNKTQTKKRNQTTHYAPSQMVTRHSSSSHQQIINTNSNNRSSSLLFNNDDDLYEF